MKNQSNRWKLSLVALGCVILLALATNVQAMHRTIKKEPALVIAAFGTTTKARVTYEFFDAQLRKELPAQYRNLKIVWAFTSEIVRERVNARFKKAGSDERYLSLPQVLANLENEGYRKVAVQSLHIFPGQEFEDMEREIEAFRTIGLRIEYGGTLLHEWPWLFETVSLLEKQFLVADEGVNVLVAHGTPESFPGSNSTYLGLDRYLSHKYPNVVAGGVDGVLTREQALDAVKESPLKRARLIPFMYVAGDHIMNDIMGEEPDKDGELSWALELKRAGVKVDTVYTDYKGERCFKGLGFYNEINSRYIEQLVESLKRLKER
ncbi:sirohydrochlorin cobaltochelatase [Thermodesulfobacteriota bacterium]